MPNRGLTTHSHCRLDAWNVSGKLGDVSSTGLDEPSSQTGVGEDMWGPHSSRLQEPRGPASKIDPLFVMILKNKYQQLPRGQPVG